MVKIEVSVDYRLLSLEAGTYITLSSDNASVIGQDYTTGSKQVWMFLPSSRPDTYFIKSVETNEYLAPTNNEIQKGNPLKTNFAPFEWQALDEPNMAVAARFVPSSNANLYIDLYGDNPAPGTVVQLWPKSGYNQVWVLERDR